MSGLKQRIVTEHGSMKFCNHGAASTVATRYADTSIREMNMKDQSLQHIHGYVQGVPASLSAIYGMYASDIQGVQTTLSAINTIIQNTYLHKEVQIKKLKTSLDIFMERLEGSDRDLLQESLKSIKGLPFVSDIKFEELDSPTIIIILSQMDDNTEDTIYQIEYDLLKTFKNNIDFLIFPV